MSFPAVFSLSSLDGTNGFRIDGIDAADLSGFAVDNAGDINGDGFDDIIVGAHYADPGGDSSAGESYVVFGKAGGFTASIDLAALDGTNGFRLDGIDSGDNSGRSVSAAGDVNGDGFADIVIGARGGDPGGDSNAGESYVVFGKAGGFAASIDLASLNGTTGFRINGIDISDTSGNTVANAGDVNGDGFDDILIGAFAAEVGANSSAGESYVIFGKSSGFVASLDLADLNGSNGFRIDGIDASDYSGYSLASAGDINGDGFDDIIISSIGADDGAELNVGESYVIFGKSGGFTASFALSSINGTNGFRIIGIDSYDNAGRALASAGDINGDGIDDLIVSAIGGDPGGAFGAGEAYVIFGRKSGFSAEIKLAELTSNTGFRINGIDAGDNIGRSVSAAGDVNGDGFNDLLVGSRYADGNIGSNRGETYVIFGKADGFALDLDLENLDGNNGFRIDGANVFDYSGGSVSGGGDVNGDGFADIIIGASSADPDGINSAGATYVVFGRMPEFGVTRIGSNIGQFISGGLGDDVLEGRGGDDVLRGQIGDDEIYGDEGNDNIDGGDGDDTISGGSGNDTLTGGEGFDFISGGSGDDIVNAGSGDDEIDTGSGNDTVVSGSGNDVLILRIGNDIANGNGGNDMLFGEAGNDNLQGGAGNDQLFGGAGSDSLSGSSGVDAMAGGADDDNYRIVDTLDTITELLNEGIDTVRSTIDFTLGANVERLFLIGGAREATGNGLNNTLLGAGGADTLTGLDGADVLRGNIGRDILLGGNGDDLLDGGTGKDTMTGGAGKDTFQFRFASDFNNSRALADVITDFDQGLAERIQLNAIDANTNTGTNDDFEWIAGNAFSNTAGELRFEQSGGDTFIEGDTNGDGVADLVIRLTGLYNLTASDILGASDLLPNNEAVELPAAIIEFRQLFSGATDIASHYIF